MCKKAKKGYRRVQCHKEEDLGVMVENLEREAQSYLNKTLTGFRIYIRSPIVHRKEPICVENKRLNLGLMGQR